MSSENILRQFIRESSFSLDDGTIVEYGSEDHINELDRIISDLQRVKSSLKNDRKFHRKESHRLQDAIGAIRYLRRKASREGAKKGILLLKEWEKE